MDVTRISHTNLKFPNDGSDYDCYWWSWWSWWWEERNIWCTAYNGDDDNGDDDDDDDDDDNDDEDDNDNGDDRKR